MTRIGLLSRPSQPSTIEGGPAACPLVGRLLLDERPLDAVLYSVERRRPHSPLSTPPHRHNSGLFGTPNAASRSRCRSAIGAAGGFGRERGAGSNVQLGEDVFEVCLDR